MTTTAGGARELGEAWRAVLGRLQVELPAHNYNTWLRGTRALKFDGARLLIEARTALSCEWLNIKLAGTVERAVATHLGREVEVEFVPQGTEVAEPEPVSPECASAAEAGRIVGRVNCSYTFERYLAAEGNMVAFSSCTALVEPDELRISPVVVFGAPGMGKTHLLHALACRAAAVGRRVVCLHAEEFTTRYLTAIRNGLMEEFQATVRTADLFVIDDLQYLTGKKGTLDELVHTIDAVTNGGGSVVVASERHPFELDLPDRLSSRLAAGVVTRVEPFRLQERRQFIEHLARHLRVALPTWTVERIAGCEVPSTRVLQGAVHAAVALSRGGRLDLAHLDAELTRLSLAEVAPCGFDDRALLDVIAHHFETTYEELAGRSRSAAVANARAAAVTALKDRGRSLSDIAAVLGKRDRSTISQLQARGRKVLDREPALRDLLAS
jgi:chromosomal replication initiator protein